MANYNPSPIPLSRLSTDFRIITFLNYMTLFFLMSCSIIVSWHASCWKCLRLNTVCVMCPYMAQGRICHLFSNILSGTLKWARKTFLFPVFTMVFTSCKCFMFLRVLTMCDIDPESETDIYSISLLIVSFRMLVYHLWKIVCSGLYLQRNFLLFLLSLLYSLSSDKPFFLALIVTLRVLLLVIFIA